MTERVSTTVPRKGLCAGESISDHSRSAENRREPAPTVVCQGCVLMMIRRCYRAHWWFRLLREPLAAGMRFLALVNGIRPGDYAAGNPECRGCLRFIKAELEIRSAAFRFLNGLIGPKFRSLRDSMLEEKDFSEAKKHAAEMMAIVAENEADHMDGKG